VAWKLRSQSKIKCKDEYYLEYEKAKVDKGSTDSYGGVQRIKPKWIKKQTNKDIKECGLCKWEWDCHGRFLKEGKCSYTVGDQEFNFFEKEGDKK